MLLTLSFARALTNISLRGTAVRQSASVGTFSSLSSRLHSTMAQEAATNTSSQGIEYPTEMTEDQKYLFDLNGFIILRGVLTPEQVEEANRAIDNHAHEMVERSDPVLRNAVKDTKFYGEGPGRLDLGQVLEWGEESKVFKSILAHPALVPVFHGILGMFSWCLLRNSVKQSLTLISYFCRQRLSNGSLAICLGTKQRI
jgi:hypothetical protein